MTESFCRLSEKKLSTIIHTVNTVKLPGIEVVDAIANVVNSEHPDLYLTNTDTARFYEKSTNEIMKDVGCRVYEKVINISSLKSSKLFMNGTSSRTVGKLR